MKNIKEQLLKLGFRAKSSGIIYWLDAFKYVSKEKNIYHMVEIYEKISKKRGKSISAIERAMRYSLEPATEKIKLKYNYNKRIDNMTFINLVRFESE